MEQPTFSKTEAAGLGLLALVGMCVPNAIFLYVAITDCALVREAMQNPVAAVFIFEAMFLMVLGAWLLARFKVAKPSALAFVVMSLVGSLAFSVPATLWLMARRRRAQ